MLTEKSAKAAVAELAGWGRRWAERALTVRRTLFEAPAPNLWPCRKAQHLDHHFNVEAQKTPL